jgi:hypothetical protein
MRMLDDTAIMVAAAKAPGVNYSVEVSNNLGELTVDVSFSGFSDPSHAGWFAKYILSLLELNGRESPSGFEN